MIELDSSDPFEAVLIPIVETNRKKRADYASDDSIFSNFIDTAHFAGFEKPWMSALFNCSQKLSRIRALRENGRLEETQNEAIADTLLDLACYSVLSLAMYHDDLRCQESLVSTMDVKASR
jgi:hypothetical protein